MPHNTSEVVALLKQQLPPDTLQQSIICWYNKSFEEGESIKAGPEQLIAPFRATLVFVDTKPKANWGHPCRYIFLSDTGNEMVTHEAQYPPFMGEPPPEYTVILRYGATPQDGRNFNPY